ncbi:DUF6404 family protein [Vibrio mediterranei]|jgi:hypothetical protein|uniref:DUF6404 family protein n=1 Tax=Vibrio barjaei TaxID=1676683 RepID=A0ABW7II98_9VIBR|nr:DUF6404 family protein [Vibrio barjaei]MCG9786854.1 DUF6404 family protein [Vibrio mediterranei]OIN23245.1 hypothetical protein AWH66_2020875 [Vibrio barjaei]
MSKFEFIQLHLIEKGVPKDLTKPSPFVWARCQSLSDTPLVFQSPLRIVLRHGVLLGLVWGALMWLMLWHREPERWISYLLSSCLFGLFMGMLTAYRAHKSQANLGCKDWKEWCVRNYV